jgi:alkyl hydroperoxide reductase subunit F
VLDATLTSQLKAYLTHVRQPVELVASLDEDATSHDMWSLLNEIAELHPDVSVIRADDDVRRPSFLIRRVGTEVGVRFAGIPLGHEFTSLVLALLQVGGHPPKLSDEVQAAIRALPGDYAFETYFSLTCQNCPDLVQAINAMSVINPRIRHTAIEGGRFQAEVEARQIMSVPAVFLNGEPFAQGRMDVEQILAKLDTSASVRAAERIAAKDPFDVLVVGGGPAGAAAAIYAARKGIRTGLTTERFGGQVLDTLAIENFISVQRTEGPKLVSEMESHVAEYGVDVMTLQRATALRPARGPGGLHEVELASGATLQTRSVILATGARWRSLGVPGEDSYRNKGVTYCPHCDGPLFTGKRVAVVGGGNSGVEAAIDLAGLVAHVTLIEVGGQLRADAVLQRKLRSLPNVTVLLDARITAIDGDGTRVGALTYVDQNSGAPHRLPVEGVFVQIGLVPNTDWLSGVVDLSPQGEIAVDGHGRTSVAGVFAAGDATVTPFKQIVIAMGEGSKASLSAFDYLIRMPALAEAKAA